MCLITRNQKFLLSKGKAVGMRQLGHVEKVEWLNPILFLLFLLSGFSSLVYQVVWLRLAFAHFGIVTPVLSLVLSVFMLGLGAGSLLGGRWASTLSRRLGCGWLEAPRNPHF